MEIEEAGRRLAEIHARLQEAGFQAAVRGAGRAAFLFAYGNGRSVEVSVDKEMWWVELRERNSDPEALAAREYYVTKDELVLQKTLEWLGG